MFVIEDESHGDLWGFGPDPLGAVQNLMLVFASRNRYLTTAEIETLIVLGEVVFVRYSTGLIMREIKL